MKGYNVNVDRSDRWGLLKRAGVSLPGRLADAMAMAQPHYTPIVEAQALKESGGVVSVVSNQHVELHFHGTPEENAEQTRRVLREEGVVTQTHLDEAASSLPATQ
jgi:hypothetical protein